MVPSTACPAAYICLLDLEEKEAAGEGRIGMEQVDMILLTVYNLFLIIRDFGAGQGFRLEFCVNGIAVNLTKFDKAISSGKSSRCCRREANLILRSNEHHQYF